MLPQRISILSKARQGRSVAVIATCSAALGILVHRDMDAEQRIVLQLSNFPFEINQMRGQDVPSRGLAAFFEEDEYLNRVYTDGVRSVSLHVALPRTPAHSQHYPSRCYTGSGYEIREKSHVILKFPNKAIRAERFVSENGTLTYFWFANGRMTWTERNLSTWLALLWDTEWQSVKYMVTTQTEPGNEGVGDKLLQTFISCIPEEFIVVDNAKESTPP